jgi:hypothetical protein
LVSLPIVMGSLIFGVFAMPLSWWVIFGAKMHNGSGLFAGVHMRLLLFFGSIVAFLAALLHVLVFSSSINQIGGYVLFLISAVLMSGAGIIEAITRLQAVVESHKPESASRVSSE